MEKGIVTNDSVWLVKEIAEGMKRNEFESEAEPISALLK